MQYIIKHFSELTTEELLEIYKLRVSVFVVEQKCPYQEVDDVARSTTLGNAKASKRGTSDRLVHAFLCPKSSFSLIFN